MYKSSLNKKSKFRASKSFCVSFCESVICLVEFVYVVCPSFSVLRTPRKSFKRPSKVVSKLKIVYIWQGNKHPILPYTLFKYLFYFPIIYYQFSFHFLHIFCVLVKLSSFIFSPLKAFQKSPKTC